MAHFKKTEGFFLLFKRGGCSFHTKIKNAEKFGAEVVLISDFEDEAAITDGMVAIDNEYTGLF